jgi:hypothetical protein
MVRWLWYSLSGKLAGSSKLTVGYIKEGVGVSYRDVRSSITVSKLVCKGTSLYEILL